MLEGDDEDDNDDDDDIFALRHCCSFHNYTSSFALCSLNQCFPNYVPRNTGVPRDVNRCPAKN